MAMTPFDTVHPRYRKHRRLLFSCKKQISNHLGGEHDLLNAAMVWRDQA
jgi:hypothetical protein